MVPAIFSLDGRSTSAHVALLIAQGLAASCQPTTRIRLSHIGEPNPFAHARIDQLVRLVEIAADPATAAIEVDKALTQSLFEGRRVVLDLPLASLRDPSLANREEIVRVIPVGPSPIDAAIARETLGVMRVPDGAGLPFLLPCGRAGDDIAMRQLLATMRGDARSARYPALPAVLPMLTPNDLVAIAKGRPTQWCLKRAAILIEAMRGAHAARKSGEAMPDGSGGPDSFLDERFSDLASTLHALAHDVAAFGEGRFPSEEELARAPILENWAHTGRIVRALVGNISGHPNVRADRRSRTSELFFTDGRSFARTHSRLYRLGTPARAQRDDERSTKTGLQ